jgi:hypothetical protein
MDAMIPKRVQIASSPVSENSIEKYEYGAFEIVHSPLDNVVWLTIFYQLFVTELFTEVGRALINFVGGLENAAL